MQAMHVSHDQLCRPELYKDEFLAQIENLWKENDIVIVDIFIELVGVDKWNSLIDRLNARIFYVTIVSDFPSYKERFKKRNSSACLSEAPPHLASS